MFLQFICLCSATAYILAASLTDEVSLKVQKPTLIPIVSLSAEYVADGKFKYSYETGNGIKREETAYDKESPQGKSHSDSSNEGGEDDDSGEIHVQKGSYSYTAPDGTLVSVRYIADENGFQPIITEVSHNGSQLSSNLPQIIRLSDAKEAEYKTIDHLKLKTQQKTNLEEKRTPTVNVHNKTSSKLTGKIEPIQKDIAEKRPLKFGDKLNNSDKQIKKNDFLLKDNHFLDGDQIEPLTPHDNISKYSKNSVSAGEEEGNKPEVETIIHDEHKPLYSVKKGETEMYKFDHEGKISKADKSENVIKKANLEKSKNFNIFSNYNPSEEIENSDKLNKNLVNKEANSKNNNSNVTDENKYNVLKPLKPETKSAKSLEGMIPVENEANLTNAKINIDSKFETEKKIPVKQTKTFPKLDTIASKNESSSAKQESSSSSNIMKHENRTLNNVEHITHKKIETPHQTENTPTKIQKEPLVSVTKSSINEHVLDNTDQLLESKEIKPSVAEIKTQITGEKSAKVKFPKAAENHLETAENSTKADENLNNMDKKSAKDDLTSLKALPSKKNGELHKDVINIPKTKNVKEIPENIFENSHEKENISSKMKNKEQSDGKDLLLKNKEVRETIKRNTNNTQKPIVEEKGKNNDENQIKSKQGKPINSLDDLVNKNKTLNPNETSKGENKLTNHTENIKVKPSILDKKYDKNRDISSNNDAEKKHEENNLEATGNEGNKSHIEYPSYEMEQNETLTNKDEFFVHNKDITRKKNETLDNLKNTANHTEKSEPPLEPSNGNLTKEVLKDIQKPVNQAEKHEMVAEKAAKEAVTAAEVAGNAADTAQKAAKDTEKVINTFNEFGNESREVAIEAAIKHAKLAREAAKKAIQAAKMADIAADNAKNAAKAAEKVIKLVESSPNTTNLKEIIDNGEAVEDTKKSANDTVNADKDAKRQSESLMGDYTETIQAPEHNNQKPPNRSIKTLQ